MVLYLWKKNLLGGRLKRIFSSLIFLFLILFFLACLRYNFNISDKLIAGNNIQTSQIDRDLKENQSLIQKNQPAGRGALIEALFILQNRRNSFSDYLQWYKSSLFFAENTFSQLRKLKREFCTFESIYGDIYNYLLRNWIYEPFLQLKSDGILGKIINQYELANRLCTTYNIDAFKAYVIKVFSNYILSELINYLTSTEHEIKKLEDILINTKNITCFQVHSIIRNINKMLDSVEDEIYLLNLLIDMKRDYFLLEKYCHEIWLEKKSNKISDQVTENLIRKRQIISNLEESIIEKKYTFNSKLKEINSFLENSDCNGLWKDHNSCCYFMSNLQFIEGTLSTYWLDDILKGKIFR